MLSCLLSNALFAALLAVVVWAIGRWLRPAPATLHALWLVVVLKLLSPFGLIYPLTLPINMGTSQPATVVPTPPAPTEVEVEETLFLADAAVAIDLEGTSPSLTLNHPEAAVATTATPASSWSAAVPSILSLLLGIWLIGAAAVALRQVICTWRFARLAAKARTAPEAVIRHVQRLAARLRVKAPVVRALPGLPSPVVWALGRPVLLWPAGLEKHLPDEGRDAVLLHELAHLRRGDHWTRWLELVAGVLYWWNPLFWLARRQMRFHAELACDAWVTGTFPAERRAYAEALLQVCATTTRLSVAPAVGVGGDGKREFERRLTMIMREQVPHRLSGGGKLAVVLLALAAVPGWVFASDDEPARIAITADEEIIVAAAADDDEHTRQIKEIEIKIAELKKDLEKLRGQKPDAAVEKGVKYLRGTGASDVIKRVAAAPGQGQVKVIIIDSATGKIIQQIEQPAGAAIGVDVKGIDADLKKRAEMLKTLTGDNVEKLRDLTTKIKVAEAAKAADAAKSAQDAAKAEVAKALGMVADAKKLAEAKAAEGRAARVLWTTQGKIEGTGGGDMVLSRATYKLPKDKAEALGAFIKEHIKGSVVEIKVDGEGLTVTTTPELQRAIRTLVGLMSGQPPTSAAPALAPAYGVAASQGTPGKFIRSGTYTWSFAQPATVEAAKQGQFLFKIAEPDKAEEGKELYHWFFKPSESKPAKPER
jgi:beta-lactamase regulating signal transducer with metallopeptidase domain